MNTGVTCPECGGWLFADSHDHLEVYCDTCEYRRDHPFHEIITSPSITASDIKASSPSNFSRSKSS